jgi:hypothetical protein
MKPFNLERALAGDPVITRDGRPVTQLTLFTNTKTYPLVGVVEGVIKAWKTNGKYFNGQEWSYDLFMPPVKREGWIIVRSPDENGIRKTSDMYPSPDVLYSHNPELIHCWLRKVEWEE